MNKRLISRCRGILESLDVEEAKRKLYQSIPKRAEILIFDNRKQASSQGMRFR